MLPFREPSSRSNGPEVADRPATPAGSNPWKKNIIEPHFPGTSANVKEFKFERRGVLADWIMLTKGSRPRAESHYDEFERYFQLIDWGIE